VGLQLSAQAKARLCGALLALVALWPLLHRPLVVIADVDPWKLFGFAMYCTPHHVSVDLIDRSRAPAREIRGDELPPALRTDLQRFSARRETLGRLASPDPLGRDVLAALPGVERLTIAITVTRLAFAGSELASHTRLHGYDRGDP
jgi:hypothetical protein